jgi:tetratricopeptide (TPR) repeat protein
MLRKIFALTVLACVSLSFSQRAQAAQPDTEPERREMLHRLLFAIYDKQGKVDDENAELSELAKLKPNDATFPVTAGRILLKQKRYDEAMAKGDEAIKADPNSADGYAMKGQVYSSQKKYKEAVEQYTIANQHLKIGQNFNAQASINQQLLDKQVQDQQYLDAINGKGKAKPKAK